MDENLRLNNSKIKKHIDHPHEILQQVVILASLESHVLIPCLLSKSSLYTSLDPVK